jgi:hypothetical protein
MTSVGPSIDFGAIRKSWQTLFRSLKLAATLPSDPAAFTARYGVYPDSSAVGAFLHAVNDLRDLAAGLSSPEGLRQALAKDGGALTGASAPPSAYGHFVWLTGQISNTAAEVQLSLVTLSEREFSAGEVRELLAGGNGLLPRVEKLRAELLAIGRKVSAFSARFLADVNELRNSDLVRVANERIGGLEVSLTELRDAVEQASKSAAGFHLLPFGQKKDRAAEQEAREQLAAAEADRVNALKLVDEVDAFTRGARDGLAALGELSEDGLFAEAARALQRFTGQWTMITGDSGQLGDPAWLRRTLDLPAAIAWWRSLEAEAQAVSTRGMVDVA